jgi:large subunit ribosomal protein L28
LRLGIINGIEGGDTLPLCQICGKGVGYGHNVSHSKRRTNRRWMPNIQKTTITIDNVQRSVRICTRCLRSLQKSA